MVPTDPVETEEPEQPVVQFVDRAVARKLDPIITSLNDQTEQFAIGRLPSPEQSKQYYFLKLPIVIELQTNFLVTRETQPAVRAGLCYFHSFRFVALGLLASCAPTVDQATLATTTCAVCLAKLCLSLKLRRLFRTRSFFLLETLIDAGLLAISLLSWRLTRSPSRLLEHATLATTIAYCLAVWGAYWTVCREKKAVDREKFDVYQYFLYLMLGYEVEDETGLDQKTPPQAFARQAELETEREEL